MTIGALTSYQLSDQLKWPLPLALLANDWRPGRGGLRGREAGDDSIAGGRDRALVGLFQPWPSAIVIRNALALPFLPFGTDSHAPRPIIAGTLRLGSIGVSWQAILVMVFAL